jgi:hypothetical protein
MCKFYLSSFKFFFALNKMAFELSRPALIAAVSFAIFAFILLLPINPKPKEGEAAVKVPFSLRLLIVILLLVPFALSVYSINCMMVGNCVIWSYIQAIMIALWVLFFIVSILLAMSVVSAASEKKIEAPSE